MENQQIQSNDVDTRVSGSKKKTKKREFKNRKTFSLKAMEALVDKVSFLKTKYDALAVNAQEKLGYHYNEILNILLFHKYVKGNKKLFDNYKKIKDAINKGYEFKKSKKVQENKMGKMMNESNATHFAINKKTNKILESWNYEGYDHNELKTFKNEYFAKDVKKSYPSLKESDYMVVTKSNLHKRNLNESSKADWQKYTYTHFALLKETNHILYGYNYENLSQKELNENKNNYFLNILSETYGSEIQPKEITIVKADKLEKLGIKNALSKKNWVGLINEAYCGKMEEDASSTNDTHFAVTKDTNKILFGWDYSDVDPEELSQFKNDYFFNDIIDMFDGYNNRNVIILTRKSLEKRGLNPNDTTNWMQSMNEESGGDVGSAFPGGIPVKPDSMSLKPGQNMFDKPVNMSSAMEKGLKGFQNFGAGKAKGKGNMKIDYSTGIVNPDTKTHQASGGKRFKVNESTNSLIDLNALMNDEIEYRKSESRTPENKFKSPTLQLIRENNRDSIVDFLIKNQGRLLPEVYNLRQFNTMSLKTLNEHYSKVVRLLELNEEVKPKALTNIDSLNKQSQKDSNSYYKNDASNKTTTMLVQKGEGDGLVYDKDSRQRKDIPKYKYQSEHQKDYLEKIHRGLEDFEPEKGPNGEVDPVWLARKEALMSNTEAGKEAFKNAQKRMKARDDYHLRTVKPIFNQDDLPKVKKQDKALKESNFQVVKESGILDQIQSFYIDEDNRKKPVIFDANKLVESFNEKELMGCKELTYKGLGQTLTEDFKNKVLNKKLLYSPDSKKVYLA